MRLDYVTIFPEYFTPLELSLTGKARQSGLIEVGVHDLRGWTTDRHRTVDDTPAGGGPGMIMKPEPWGAALDELASNETVLVVPTPSGAPMSQRLAQELAEASHLLFACGRYEGIDQRVLDYAGSRMTVREVSLGDYVLNGGEVAALAITEAVVRLLPGFMGNASSLEVESHTGGLLEAPTYTRPSVWRGLAVPEVLTSGDHARVEAWKAEQSRARTSDRRPDLLPASAVSSGEHLAHATPADAGEILTLQRACWLAEQQANPEVAIPALAEDLDEVAAWITSHVVLTCRRGSRLVGAVRAVAELGAWDIGRLMVAPDLQGQGLGRLLLGQIEDLAPTSAKRFQLFTGRGSERNLRMYRRAGYRMMKASESGAHVPDGAVLLQKATQHQR